MAGHDATAAGFMLQCSFLRGGEGFRGVILRCRKQAVVPGKRYACKLLQKQAISIFKTDNVPKFNLTACEANMPFICV